MDISIDRCNANAATNTQQAFDIAVDPSLVPDDYADLMATVYETPDSRFIDM